MPKNGENENLMFVVTHAGRRFLCRKDILVGLDCAIIDLLQFAQAINMPKERLVARLTSELQAIELAIDDINTITVPKNAPHTFHCSKDGLITLTKRDKTKKPQEISDFVFIKTPSSTSESSEAKRCHSKVPPPLHKSFVLPQHPLEPQQPRPSFCMPSYPTLPLVGPPQPMVIPPPPLMFPQFSSRYSSPPPPPPPPLPPAPSRSQYASFASAFPPLAPSAFGFSATPLPQAPTFGSASACTVPLPPLNDTHQRQRKTSAATKPQVPAKQWDASEDLLKLLKKFPWIELEQLNAVLLQSGNYNRAVKCVEDQFLGLSRNYELKFVARNGLTSCFKCDILCFAQLKHYCSEEFASYSIKYSDSDGDLIKVTSDEEFKEAGHQGIACFLIYEI